MTPNQLEITLKVRPCLNSAIRRQRRVSRARWWFAQMRRAVNQAQQWERQPEPAADQLALVSAGPARPA